MKNIIIIAGEDATYENERYFVEWSGGYGYLDPDDYSLLFIRDKVAGGNLTFNVVTVSEYWSKDSYKSINNINKLLKKMLSDDIIIKRKKVDVYCEELDEHFIIPIECLEELV